MDDAAVLAQIRDEWVRRRGNDIPVQGVVVVLDAIVARDGERVSVAGACNTLDDLMRIANLVRGDLEDAKRCAPNARA